MFVKLCVNASFHHLVLAHPVRVELSILAAKLVLSLLTVVVFEMVDDGGGHMGVLFSSSDCWEQSCSRLFHEISGEQPHWHDDRKKVREPEEETLLATLNPQRVQMHVEFGSEVTI